MPGRTRSWLRGRVEVPGIVVAATVAFAALAALWSVVAPLAEAPDEPAHLGLVLYLADGHAYPDYDELATQASVFRLCRTYASATRACPGAGEAVSRTSTRLHIAGAAPDRASRPTWDERGGARRAGVNQMPQHPPLYYEALALVLRVERAVAGGPWSLDRELALLRLVNVAMVAPLPLLAWWTARRGGFGHQVAVVAALVPLALPMATHIGSTVNNDNLLTLCGAGVVFLLAGVATGDRSAVTASLVGAVTGVALLTKASAVVFLPAIAVAYLVGRRRGGGGRWHERLSSALPGVLAGLVAVALSGWWYLRVRVRTGQFAPTVEQRRLTTALRPPGFHTDVARFAQTVGRFLPQRFWGSFGWYSVRFSSGFSYVLTAAVVALVAAAFAPWRRYREPGPGGAVLASVLLPFVLLGAFVVWRSWTLYGRTSRFLFIQGRYLFPGLTGLAVAVALGAVRAAGRWALPAVAATAAAMQAWALHRAVLGFWGGPGVGPRGRLDALVAWSGWPGNVFPGLAGGLVASLLWLGWTTRSEWRLTRSARGRPVGSSTP